MKYFKRYTILISVVLLIFISCIKEVEFTGEETAPLPVLNCVVGDGDTVVYADLTKSLFFLRRGDFAPITDAEVTLTCNGTEYPMTLVGDSVYMLRHTFAAGDLVSISATMPEFGTISSETSLVPVSPTVAISELNMEGNDAKSFTIKFFNNDPENTFYKLSVFSKLSSDSISVSEEDPIWYKYISCYDSRVLLTNSDFPSVNEGQYLLFPGRNFSGDTCTLTIDFEETIEPRVSYYVEVTLISESLYKYISTLHNHYDTRYNPFSEPVQVYTNISGGLGIFGTKSRVEKNIVNNLYDISK